jgi:hypothetical protein
LALGEDEQHLVPEGGRDGVVKQGRNSRFFAGFVKLDALFRFHARRGVERMVDLRGEYGCKLVVHHHARSLILTSRRGLRWG